MHRTAYLGLGGRTCLGWKYPRQIWQSLTKKPSRIERSWQKDKKGPIKLSMSQHHDNRREMSRLKVLAYQSQIQKSGYPEDDEGRTCPLIRGISDLSRHPRKVNAFHESSRSGVAHVEVDV